MNPPTWTLREISGCDDIMYELTASFDNGEKLSGYWFGCKLRPWRIGIEKRRIEACAQVLGWMR